MNKSGTPLIENRFPSPQTLESQSSFAGQSHFSTMQVPHISLLMDFENCFIAMRDRGYPLEPVRFYKMIYNALQFYGEITASKAYADWGMLDPVNGLALQKSLASEGVEVIYLANQRGKNTADMRIVGDIRDQLEAGPYAPHSFDMLALVSGDRDFTDVIRSVRARGKPVVVLGFRGSMSVELGRTADRMIYLDEYFVQQRVFPSERFARLAVHAAVLNRQKNGTGFTDQDLARSLGRQADAADELKEALNQGFLLRETQTNLLFLNTALPLIKAAAYLVSWVPEKIKQGLKRPGFTYVDTNYLVNGARFDQRLCVLGILGGRQEMESWLWLLAETGLVTKTRRTAAKDPTYEVIAWWTCVPET